MSTDERPTRTLPSNIFQYYSENGITDLAKESVPYLARQYIRKRQITAAEAQEASNSGRVWIDEGEETISIPKAENARLRREFESYPTKFSPEPGAVYEIENCNLVGPNAVGLYEGKKLIPETSGFRYGNTYMGSGSSILKEVFKSALGFQPGQTADIVFPLICPDPSYYHWVMEYLPKLRLYELYLRETDNEPTILIEPNPRDFVRDSLEFLGFDSIQYKQWNQKATSIEKLIVSTHRPHIFDYRDPESSDYNPSVKDFNWIRERARSTVDQKKNTSDGEKRIYVSRQGAQRERKVTNIDQVSQILRKYGFELYQLEALTFREQVQLFYDADVIMGPHGAGLLNMMFAGDPTVIELFPETIIKPHFYYLSAMFEFEYESVVVDSKESNLQIDPTELEDYLSLALE
ncbi:glycosyltransferase family 61 protein [Halorubrum ejinorense]|uniref:Glycosyltransferase family 61 protein n=1 Tax=Halorubrum ejinorense TaxID=425309 RepID=A0AAV3SW12_9EURY